MTQPSNQDRFSTQTNDFAIDDHDRLRAAMRAGAQMRNKSVGQLSLAAGLGAAPAAFASGKNQSISTSVVLQWFTASGFLLTLRAPGSAQDGSGDYRIASVADMRDACLALVKASGNSVSAVAEVSGAGNGFTKFVLHPGQHDHIKIFLLFRILAALQVEVRVIDMQKGRRAR